MARRARHQDLGSAGNGMEELAAAADDGDGFICSNCSKEINSESEFPTKVTAFSLANNVSGGTSRISVLEALATVFNLKLDHSLYSTRNNLNMQICFPCGSYLAEMYRNYQEFLQLSATSSVIYELIKLSLKSQARLTAGIVNSISNFESGNEQHDAGFQKPNDMNHQRKVNRDKVESTKHPIPATKLVVKAPEPSIPVTVPERKPGKRVPRPKRFSDDVYVTPTPQRKQRRMNSMIDESFSETPPPVLSPQRIEPPQPKPKIPVPVPEITKTIPPVITNRHAQNSRSLINQVAHEKIRKTINYKKTDSSSPPTPTPIPTPPVEVNAVAAGAGAETENEAETEIEKTENVGDVDVKVNDSKIKGRGRPRRGFRRKAKRNTKIEEPKEEEEMAVVEPVVVPTEPVVKSDEKASSSGRKKIKETKELDTKNKTPVRVPVAESAMNGKPIANGLDETSDTPKPNDDESGASTSKRIRRVPLKLSETSPDIAPSPRRRAINTLSPRILHKKGAASPAKVLLKTREKILKKATGTRTAKVNGVRKGKAIEQETESDSDTEVGFVEWTPQGYHCLNCGRVEMKETKMIEHLISVHQFVSSLATSFCSQAQKNFVEKEVPIKRSVTKTHKSPNARQCECGKTFNTTQALQIHKKKEHGHLTPFACSFPGCELTFALRHSLTRHMKIHPTVSSPPITIAKLTPKKSLATCKICMGILESKAALALHMQNHLKSASPGKSRKLFKCNLCNRFFQSASFLKIHKMRNHADEPASASASAKQMNLCDQCPKAFYTKDSLRRHKKQKHMLRDNTAVKCPICKILFPSKATMASHRLTSHKFISEKLKGKKKSATPVAVQSPKSKKRKTTKTRKAIPPPVEVSPPQVQAPRIEPVVETNLVLAVKSKPPPLPVE